MREARRDDTRERQHSGISITRNRERRATLTENTRVAALAQEDDRIGERFESRWHGRFEGLTRLRVVVLDDGDAIDRSGLGDGAVENLSQIIILTGIARLFKVVMKRRIKERKLLAKLVQVLDAILDAVFPKLAHGKRDRTFALIQWLLARFLAHPTRFFADLGHKVAHKLARDVLDSWRAQAVAQGERGA